MIRYGNGEPCISNSNEAISRMAVLCEQYCKQNWGTLKERVNDYQGRRGLPLVDNFLDFSDIWPFDLVIRDFKFTLESSSKPSVIAFEETIENPSKYVETEVDFSKSVQAENSSSFSFNESIVVGISASFKVKPPFSEVSTTINTEVSFDSSQEFSKREIQSWEFANKYTIKAGHSVNIKCIVTNEQATALYTTKLIWGPSTWFGIYNESMRKTSWIPVNELFTEEELRDKLSITLSGKFEGSQAIKAIARVEDIGGDDNYVLTKNL